MTTPSIESKPLRERLAPQTSIQFFFALIAISAFVMYTVRSAVIGDVFWAKIATLLIAIVLGCFLAYAALFFVSNVFTAPFRATAGTDQENSAADDTPTDTGDI